MIFGSKSERFVGTDESSQLLLGLDVPSAITQTPEKETITYDRQKPSEKDKKIHSRLSLPGHLPCHEVVIEPTADTSQAKKIGEEIT